jgi:hypothetical protein
VQLLRGDERESVAEVEAELSAKDGTRSGSGSIVFVNTVVENVLEQIEILFHRAQIIIPKHA